MKVKYEIVEKRRNDLLTLIHKVGNISVKQLLNEFDISEITLRRDLRYWEDKGAIIRYHGGAKIAHYMLDTDDDNFNNKRYKHAIAKRAAQFVEDGDTIFINTSSTAILVSKYIKYKRCTIITNNAKILSFKLDPLITVILTGGEIRYPKESMVGDFAVNNLSKIRANKCFLGCSGIHSKIGVTTAIFSEQAINEMMVHNTIGKSFILCDYTKIGQAYSYISASLQSIDYIITDINTTEMEMQDIKNTNPNLEFIVVEPINPHEK